MTAFLKRGLKLRHLQLLATLQDSGQLGQAAEDLGMAQPAASRLMAEIEAIVASEIDLAAAEGIGRARRIEDGRGRYQEFVKTTFPSGLRLDGLKVVIDCANGAAYKAAPLVLWELGAEVIPVGVAPNGTNINEKCGSTYTQTAAEAVVAHGAHVGISLDGDADRVMILDETGRVADGDQIMALLAARWAEEGRLLGGTLVWKVSGNVVQDGITYRAVQVFTSTTHNATLLISEHLTVLGTSELDGLFITAAL